MERVRVLVFPSGTEGALEIYNALRYNLHFEIFGVSGKRNHTDYTYPPGHYFYGDERLYINHPEFEYTFTALVKRLNIQYIIPTFDDVTLRLAQIQQRLPAKIVTSPYETVLTASNKKLMYQSVRGLSFEPKIYRTANEVDAYPIFLKPAVGTASQGVQRIDNREQLAASLAREHDVIICEYLPGDEVSVDCFTDRHGDLLFVGPRLRERVWHGITLRGKTIYLTDELKDIAVQLNTKHRFRGAWYFQAKQNIKGQFKLLEFSVRQATNSSMYEKLGVNFSLLSLFDAMDMDVKILFNDYPLEQERRLQASYHLQCDYDAVYIDLDDTLVLNGKVNTNAMKFIYQCLNDSKKVFLLTRHFGDLDNTLKRCRISKNMFDDVIWIKDNRPKAEYIIEKNAIFIDNYFRERDFARQHLGIPVFDVDAIDCLISEN